MRDYIKKNKSYFTASPVFVSYHFLCRLCLPVRLLFRGLRPIMTQRLFHSTSSELYRFVFLTEITTPAGTVTPTLPADLETTTVPVSTTGEIKELSTEVLASQIASQVMTFLSLSSPPGLCSLHLSCGGQRL